MSASARPGAADALARLGGLKGRLPRLPSGRVFSGSGDAGPRRLMLMAGVMLLGAGGILWVVTSGRHAPVLSQDARMKPVDPLPGGLNSTPEQDKLALRANNDQAQAALQRGVSFTPAMAPSQKFGQAPPGAEAAAPAAPAPVHGPVFVTRPAPPPAVPQPLQMAYAFPEPAPVVKPPPVVQVAAVDPQQVQLYQKQIGDLFSQWGGRAPRTDVVMPATQPDGGGTSGAADSAQPVASTGGTRAASGTGASGRGYADTQDTVLIPAGRGIYAHPILALSSDETSPAVFQADSGPIAGDRMIGTFSRENDRLIIHIGSVIHNGQDLSADGVVIAPDTMEASVATAVDQHYLTRFILPAAAAFVQGLGQALETTSNTAAVLSPFGGATTTTNLNFHQQLGVAAGAAAGQIGAVLNQAAPKGPTTSLDANVSVGVMFLSNVVEHHGG